MKKVYYHTDKDIKQILIDLYADDADAHNEAYTSMVLYMLEKGGLLEGGMPLVQFDAIFKAFIEANDAMGELILEGIIEE